MNTVINKNEILSIIKKPTLVTTVINIIKRYCAFYIFLGISYNYEGDRDLFITNIMEISKSQKDSTFQIENFFNSDNNSKIIEFYQFIKHILNFTKIKDIEKVKILLQNNPLIYENTITIFNELGEDYINNYFMINDNFHNILKTIIFKLIYLKEDKQFINDLLNEKELENAEYMYIDVIYSNDFKIIDYKNLHTFLDKDEIRKGLALEYYDFLEENKDESNKIIGNMDIIDYLFTEKILIPISEDYLRYHKDSEKYSKEKISESDNLKLRDATKIKFIVNKESKVKSYHSNIYNKNENLRKKIEEFFYKPMRDRNVILYNDNEEVNIINKLENSENTNDLDLLYDLINFKKYSYNNFKDFSKDGFKLRPKKMIQSIRYTNLNSK